MIAIITRIKKLYNLLDNKQKQELLRTISSESMEKYIKLSFKFPLSGMGTLYSISDSKRIKILTDLFENNISDAIHRNQKHMRFLNKTAFKAIFGIIKDKLGKKREIVGLYPEFFI